MHQIPSLDFDRLPGLAELDGVLEEALAGAGCPLCRVLRVAEAGLSSAGVDVTGRYCEAHLCALIDSHDAFTAATVALAALDRAFAGGDTRCAVCERLSDVARKALTRLGDGVAGGALRGAYARSDGLCRRHLNRAGELEVPGAGLLRDDGRVRLRLLRRRLEDLRRSYDAAGPALPANGAWLGGVAALRRAPGQLALPAARLP
jgi:hypothetical protein